MYSSGSIRSLRHCQTPSWLGALMAVTLAFLTGSLALQAAPVPADKPTAYPSWWFARSVVRRIDPVHDTNPSWLHGSYRPADDYAAVNIGQLKQIATAAYDELKARQPDAISADLTTLMKSWFQVDVNGNFVLDAQGNRIPQTNDRSDDYAAANLGQIKAVASLFYTGLVQVGYCSGRPWDNGQADDYALANLGQLKKVFSFDVALDANGDWVPDWWEANYAATHQNVPTTAIDWWELYYLGAWGIDPNSLAPSGDGMTLLQKFQEGVDPDLYQSVPLDQQSPVRLVVYTHLE